MTLLVDDPYSKNLEIHYEAAPNRLVVLGTDGQVAFCSGQGPFQYDPGEALKKALQRVVVDVAVVADSREGSKVSSWRDSFPGRCAVGAKERSGGGGSSWPPSSDNLKHKHETTKSSTPALRRVSKLLRGFMNPTQKWQVHAPIMPS